MTSENGAWEHACQDSLILQFAHGGSGVWPELVGDHYQPQQCHVPHCLLGLMKGQVGQVIALAVYDGPCCQPHQPEALTGPLIYHL